MSHPEGGTSCPLHPVVVGRVSMCSRVCPSGNQEVRGQVTMAAAGRVNPGKLDAILIFPVVAASERELCHYLDYPYIVTITITTVIMIIIFILVIFITTTAIIIIKKRKYDGNKEQPSSCACSMEFSLCVFFP